VFGIREAQVAADSAAYLRIVALGNPPAYMAAAMSGVFTGVGNTRIPFYCNAAGLLINIVLDPLMIFTFGWGIEGAAIATVVAQWVVWVLLLLAILRHKDRPFKTFRLFAKPDRAVLRQILRWSTPISLESGLFTLLAMIITRAITPFGSDALAVQRVGSQVESLSWLLGGGFGSAVTAFMGQNFGAKAWDRIERGFRISTFTMLCYGAAVTVLMFFGGYALFALFLPDEPIRQMGATYLRIVALCQVGQCMEGVGAGLFRGMGRTVPPSVSSIASNVLRVGLCYALAATPLGLDGIWWGVTVTALLRGVVVYLWSLRAKRGLAETAAAL
jgi:putative MATE family efflux protein